MASSVDEVLARIEQGFRFVALGSDARLLAGGGRGELVASSSRELAGLVDCSANSSSISTLHLNQFRADWMCSPVVTRSISWLVGVVLSPALLTEGQGRVGIIAVLTNLSQS